MSTQPVAPPPLQVFHHGRPSRVCVKRHGRFNPSRPGWFTISEFNTWMPCPRPHPAANVIDVPNDDQAQPLAIDRALNDVARRIRESAVDIDGDNPWSQRAREHLEFVEQVRRYAVIFPSREASHV